MNIVKVKQFLYEFFVLCGKYDIDFSKMTFICDSQIYNYSKNSSEQFVLEYDNDIEVIDIHDYHYISLDSFTEKLTGVNGYDLAFEDYDDSDDYDDADVDFC